MKFLLSHNPKLISENLRDNNITAQFLSFDTCHPNNFKEVVNQRLEAEQEYDNGVYLCYNIQALNVIDPNMILWVDIATDEEGFKEIVIQPFMEVFEYWQGLDVGDIFYTFCNSKQTYSKIEVVENGKRKVKYHSPGFDKI